ncbi:hypothetical protein [Adhaeribacter aquaticus]|uniref:hypothetical protein n=1 Tax=Adhaeribacter aquaticus TaxID=299567 RepID=UPI0004209627|nr:hypothetical protein [Adhaeribacter aquaticus]
MISLFYTAVVLLILAYFMVMPKRNYNNNRPSEGNDDDGGEPVGYDLPDLDLPPGISLPINDFEPDYNRKPSRIFVDEDGTLIFSK